MNFPNLADNKAAVNSNLGTDRFFNGATLAFAARRLELPSETIYATQPYALLLASLNKCKLKLLGLSSNCLGIEMLSHYSRSLNRSSHNFMNSVDKLSSQSTFVLQISCRSILDLIVTGSI